MSFTVLNPQPNAAQSLSALSGTLLGGYLNNLQQTQQRSEEHNKLAQALTQAENMPGISPEQKQTIGLYKALKAYPEIAEKLAPQLIKQQELGQEQAKVKARQDLISKRGQQVNQPGQPTIQSQNIPGAPQQNVIPNQENAPRQKRVPSVTEQEIFDAEAIGDHQFATALREQRKEELKSIADEEKNALKQQEIDIRKEQLKLNQEQASEGHKDKLYKDQKDFIDGVTDQAIAWETQTKPKLMQMQNMDPEKIVGPTAAQFLETMGIPLGALDDPSSELYSKLSQDLLKGLPETYGNRILKVEVDNFLKTIPTLVNSPEGRRMIASNMLKLGQMKEVFYKEMRQQQKALLDENKQFPRDFQQRVFDQVSPQISKINGQFMKMSEVTSVPPGTTPFFNPQGEIEFVPNNQVDWALKNGGEKIW